MARRRFTDKDRARIFANANGVCHLCGGKIDGVREAWEIEHVIAWELTRDDSDDNLQPAHKECHKRKTHERDRPAINQAKRREARHTGVKRPAGTIPQRPKAPKPVKDKLPIPARTRAFGRPVEFWQRGELAQPGNGTGD